MTALVDALSLKKAIQSITQVVSVDVLAHLLLVAQDCNHSDCTGGCTISQHKRPIIRLRFSLTPELRTWTRRWGVNRTSSNFGHMRLPKTMRLQWHFWLICLNANYRQSVRIIGNPYTLVHQLSSLGAPASSICNPRVHQQVYDYPLKY